MAAQAKLTTLVLGLLLLETCFLSLSIVTAEDDFHDNDGDGLVDDASIDKVNCATTGASPLAEDARQAVDHLINLPQDQYCCQSNCQGSKCTTMSKAGGAATNICTFYIDDCDWCFKCAYLATLFERIGNECESFVNGIPEIGGSREIEAYGRHFSVAIF